MIPDGVWPVMLTPFRANLTIDWEGLDRLIDWYVEAGVAGLFAVCLSGEMFDLDEQEPDLMGSGRDTTRIAAADTSTVLVKTPVWKPRKNCERHSPANQQGYRARRSSDETRPVRGQQTKRQN